MASIHSSKSRFLEDVFNHVALPPRLPGRQDANLPGIECDLIDRLQVASFSFVLDPGIESLRRSLHTARCVNLNGSLTKQSLLSAFRDLNYTDFILIHIGQQNAALIIRREKSDLADEVVFEAFEASPVSENVLAAKGSLQWDFPGSAVAIPTTDFDNSDFQDELATFLEKASTESIKQFAAHILKAGSITYESRDTVDPAIITTMLMTVFEVTGRRILPILLRKKVRDEVYWDKGEPWRRCPFWLCLRVAVQRHFYMVEHDGLGRLKYKILMCFLLARLLTDCIPEIQLELLFYLKSKLCRRVVKLESEKAIVEVPLALAYEKLLVQARPFLAEAVSSASRRINIAWEVMKKKMQRPVFPLPMRLINPYLQLRCSRRYLDQLLNAPRFQKMAPSNQVWSLPQSYRHTARTTKPATAFANHYFQLAITESELNQQAFDSSKASAAINYKQNCMGISKSIEEYLGKVGSSYDSNPEQKSVMLLTVMELWMAMDSNAVKAFDLLRDYNSGFPVQILDVLHLPQRKDMIRLQKIRTHIQQRDLACKYPRMTMFSNVQRGCFAERFYDDSAVNHPLLEVHELIEDDAARSREEKEQELQIKNSQYEEIARELMVAPCTRVSSGSRKMISDVDECRHCELVTSRSKCTIRVHEHPLPVDPSQAKSAIFEMACPEPLLAYRQATWRILGTLGLSEPLQGDRPRILLRDYKRLVPYGSSRKQSNSSGFCMASTSKSFRFTHYTVVPLPTTIESVCKPNGMHLSYFDTRLELWPGDLYQKPSFAHHCRMSIPPTSPFALFNYASGFDAVSMGPSSNEIIASQTRCPPGTNVHEFVAFQILFAGKARRWPQLLVELGSSNINFSTDAVTSLIQFLALQAGPGMGDNHLGVICAVFKDKIFCENLIQQLEQRLDAISTNWRDTNSMESLITIGLRIFELGVGVTEKAKKLLEKARTIINNWVANLRIESRHATDAETALRCSRFALSAALLCRRTFAIFLHDGQLMDATALESFIRCSVTLQENLGENPSMLIQSIRRTLVRDIKMVSELENFLLSTIKSNEETLIASVTSFWHSGRASSGSTASVEYLSNPDGRWIQIEFGLDSQTQKQVIHFNFLEGHLLVMGKPVGRLPPEWAGSNVVKSLFRGQNLLAFPSSLNGMTYMLAVSENGHQIHLGRRKDDFIVKACLNDTVLELVPRSIFTVGNDFDLPSDLVDDCIHWLDLKTGIIEIRSQRSLWIPKPGNWRLDIRLGQATTPKLTLVDPHHQVFKLVAEKFSFFEWNRHITVYQPKIHGSRLTVELRRLELLFFVNRRGLLECSQLRAEIDPDQDAGTWYGLRSKLVLRDLAKQRDPVTGHLVSTPLRQRSILVPMGNVKTEINGPHLNVTVDNNGDYGKYVINDVLGRLDCAAEPRLLYLKAAYHALTSFIVPDPLTGRTGTEEAIHCLKSGYCQPWSPITPGPYRGLQLIANLTPLREYYPQNIKSMQRTTCKYDGFRSLVDDILAKSEQLSKFAITKVELEPLVPVVSAHLVLRSQFRRQCYQRPAATDFPQPIVEDVYEARDCLRTSRRRLNVAECVNLLRKWPSSLQTTKDLAGVLQEWSSFQGYTSPFEKVLLTDTLDVDWQKDWGSLVNLCRQSTSKDVYQLIFLLGAVSFRADANMDAVRTLVAYSTIDDLKRPAPPVYTAYLNFRQNHVPDLAYIIELLKPCLVEYGSDERTSGDFTVSLKMRRRLEALELAHNRQLEKDTKCLAEFLLNQWPCAEPSLEEFTNGVMIDLSQAIGIIRQEWLCLFQNLELSGYVSQIQSILNQHHSLARPFDLVEFKADGEIYAAPRLNAIVLALPLLLCQITSDTISTTVVSRGQNDRMYETQIPVLQQLVPNRQGVRVMPPPLSEEIRQLQGIVAVIAQSSSNVERQYGEDLGRSVAALMQSDFKPQQQYSKVIQHQLQALIAESKAESQRKLQIVQDMLVGQYTDHYWRRQGALWPPITPVSILEALRFTSKFLCADGVQNALINYAFSITALQRLLRLEDASQKGHWQRLAEEQQNTGHQNWIPSRYPDWLLLEIDANVLLRPSQVDVAFATISPASDSNSVLQMNMGQGKTSCIISMAAAVLADSQNLLRVVVPKSLLLQTAQLLHARLGGLIGRELRHVPFSRKTPTDPDTVGAFLSIHRTMQESSGVIIALPEHLLSFKLSGLQRLSDGLISEAKTTIQVQSWLSRRSRDVIDECDSILALRTQLIYPSGSQMTVDGHPIRWEIAETILGRVDGHLHNIQISFPHSLAVIRREQGGFPVMFFLRKDVEDELISRLIDDIYRGRTSIFPADCPQRHRQVIRDYISQAKVKKQTWELVSKMFKDKPALRHSMHLLRGLFVHRILLMNLKRRWNVQYGLHPNRDPIAVPYHAKGTPSDQAEWGHPDVAILSTCLAFYYDGLSLSQLSQTLEHVLKCDDPNQVYDRFSQKSSLPDALREWNAINIDDEIQLAEILSHLRYNTVVIDYFLNIFVFPRHAKQFQFKLQASGWDIPLASTRLEQRLTTGFSGTNDSKRMLPLTIHQRDLHSLTNTNAEVLTYLLRNRRYVLAADHLGRHISEIEFLQKIFEVKGIRIRVLIDAGAQILEMKNVDLVRAWLDIDFDAQAGVYFDENSKPMVIYRNNYSRQTPLVATPFVDDLSGCLVYMDQAHTRGTDLKLPADARRALTLGIDQSKDHTVQAAMRLRQLGTTQSITFFAPPEVNQSILDHSQKKSSESVTSYDVVRWLLEQTCRGMEQLQPLYFSQGADFCRRAQAELDNPNFLGDSTHREFYVNSLRQVEQQTLEQLYGPKTKGKVAASIDKYSPELHVLVEKLDMDRKEYQDNGNAVHGSALQEVEQEREVAYEVEAIREVQVPVHYPALKPSPLHRDLLTFANTGRMAADSAAYEPAFAAMQRFSICKKFGVSCQGTSGNLYMSSEFTRTIKVRLGDSAYDNFQRPVHWILYSTVSDTAIILVPEEVELILPIVRNSASTASHILSYAAPITRKMLHFNGLSYYAVPNLPLNWEAPAWLRTELGIYAGRLYFDFSEYSTILAFLGVKETTSKIEEEDIDHLNSSEGTELLKIEVNGIDVSIHKAFTRKPLAFLQEWLAIRRKGQDFTETPMGYICQGKQLSENHPFFRQREAEGSKKVPIAKVRVVAEDRDDDDGHGGYNHEEYDPVQEGDDKFDYSTLKENNVSDKDEGGSEYESYSDAAEENLV
ncbi:uncharacterized protein RAG0_09953 [Rhynchosporium agropyri]|uniref:ubiquitinyl hydrolase 1 n=1 Tax=Rhynchosporium agropyri TaxID=914238 RepID=A0A1E1KXU5_9HELO|nr:uncharacterized protein RAG0_09953 [Rhynchosporium agropyri]